MRRTTILALLGASMLLIGCSAVYAVEKSTLGNSSDTEVKVVRASAGEILTLDYEATVESGALEILLSYVGTGDQVIWKTSLRNDGRDSVQITLPESGQYRLTVQEFVFGGHYRVSLQGNIRVR